MSGMDRRALIAALGGAGLAALAGCQTVPQTSPLARPGFFERTGLPVGLQFGAIGNDAARDIDAAFAQVAGIGYREVELSNLFGRKPAELAAAAAKAGVKIASLHLPLMAMGGPAALSMMSDAARIAEVMGALGAKWAVAPILMIPRTFRPMPGEAMETAVGRAIAGAGEDIWKQTAEVLNTRASALQPLGVGLAYHNHNLDFAPIGKTTGWQILWRETDPGLVHFEVDVGWVDLAGIDPVRFLEKSSGRVRLLHAREIAAGKPRSFDISMTSPAVGTGRLDWAHILPAAYRAGARHVIVEQDPPPGTSRIDAIGQSFRFLSQLR